MALEVQVGTILIKENPGMAQAIGFQTEPYTGIWGLVKMLDALAMDREIHAAGWNFFFMAAQLKVIFFGAIETKSIQKAIGRILGKLKPLNFNCLEVTGIIAKRFLGVPYTSFRRTRATFNRVAASMAWTNGGDPSTTPSKHEYRSLFRFSVSIVN